MNYSKKLATFALGAAISSMAFAQNTGRDTTKDHMGGQPSGTAGGATGSVSDTGASASIRTSDLQTEGKTADERFVRHQISANNFEVQLSQLAQQKAQDPQVKQFAQQMVQDHTQALQQLRPVAQKLNVEVSQQYLNPVHQATLDMFRKKDGKEFEHAYIAHQVGDHHKNIVEYQFMARDAQDDQLKQLCQQMPSKLTQHLAMINRIADASGADTARTASERIGPGGSSGMHGSGTDSGRTGSDAGRSGAGDADHNHLGGMSSGTGTSSSGTSGSGTSGSGSTGSDRTGSGSGTGTGSGTGAGSSGGTSGGGTSGSGTGAGGAGR